MKLTVLGASGGTGQQLARQAIAAGHEVTAIVRRPEAIPAPGPQLRVVRGDLLDPQWTGEGIDGAEAVLSALGATERGPTTLSLTGHARTAIGKPLPGGRVVSRADLAAAVLAAIGDRTTVRQAVAIAR
jgi:putative NADH-flavin reductase